MRLTMTVIARRLRSLRRRSSRNSGAGNRNARLQLETLEDRTLPSSISGTVFNDLNGDGVQGSTEPGLPGWEVDLFQGQTLVKALGTDGNGNFTFSNLNPGTYTIQEVLLPNWLRTSTPAMYTVTIPILGADVNGRVFGNFQLVRISGTVFNDLNGNGVQDPG